MHSSIVVAVTRLSINFKKYLVYGACLVIVVIGISYGVNKRLESDGFPEAVGNLSTAPNSRLQGAINAHVGREDYYCENILYGYDDSYAYAWVYCSGLEVTGHSLPARFKYAKESFIVTEFDQPGEHARTVGAIFPKQLGVAWPIVEELDRLERITRMKAEAVIKIKEKYPELREYPSDTLPPRSITVEYDQDNVYIAFIQNGSGRPFLGARCFVVQADNTILEREKFSSNVDSDRHYNFSAKECASY